MIGQTISQYVITAKLGAGGMGEVFLADDTRLKRQVALKFLPQHFSTNHDVRARFQREAEALAALNHPNIVSVYDVSEFEGRPFIVMEYVKGQTLKEFAASGDIDTDRVIEVAAQIAEGLTAAHESEIVHRDIKPDNLIITPKGRVKIMDFGLVTWRGVSQLTQEGSTVGTMAYMSPEQVQGKATDHRADLWSLGVVLYELLTTHLPFGGEHEAALAYAIMQEDPQPLARYRSDSPPILQDVISRALEKDPETRYQSAAGFSADLKRAQRISDSQMQSYAGKPVVAAPERPHKKRGFVVTASVAAVVILTLLILRPWEFTVRPTQDAQAVENRLAVMYFDNLTDPDDAQRNGEIMANLLMSDLSGSSYLQVVSSQRLYDILKQLGQEGVKLVDRETATQVAQKAKARWMLTGSILRMSPNIVVTAQLVDVASGTMIASPRITSRAGEDIFAVVDSLSARIKTHLVLPVEALAEGDRAVTELTTTSTDAYRHYLQGWEYYFQLQNRRAEEQFNKAIAADSVFAMAYYGLAWVASGHFDIRKKMIARARELSGGLREIDQWKILALEAGLDQRDEEAVTYLEKIVEADPDDKSAYYLLSMKYREWPYFDLKKSAAMLMKVLEIDPFDKTSYNRLAYAFESLGQTDSSLWAINKYIELAPNEPNPYDSRAELYGFSGNIDAAIASYRKALEVDSTYVASVSGLMRMHVFRRDYERAERIIQGGVSNVDRDVRRGSRMERARIMLHRGRLAEYLSRYRFSQETTRVEFGSDLRETGLHYDLLEAFLGLEDLTDDPQWVDSAAVQFTLFREMFARDTANGHADTLNYLHLRSRMENLSGDASATNTNISELLAMLDTTTYFDRMRYGRTLTVLQFDQDNYDSTLSLALRFIPRIRSTEYSIWLGRLYFLTGQYAKAVEDLEFAEKRFDQDRYDNPGLSVRLHYWLGRSYEESGWTDKAIDQFEVFTEIWKDADPGIPDLEDARARLARLKTGS